MLPYVVCYCGRSLGDKYHLFRAMVHDAYVKHIADNGLDIKPDMILYSDKVAVDIGHVFDSLHLNLECCRARMNTQLRFNQYY